MLGEKAGGEEAESIRNGRRSCSGEKPESVYASELIVSHLDSWRQVIAIRYKVAQQIERS